MSKSGRPRGGKHHEKVRKYWREEKGYPDKEQESLDLETLTKILLGRKK